MVEDWDSFFIWVKSTEQAEWEAQVKEYEKMQKEEWIYEN